MKHNGPDYCNYPENGGGGHVEYCDEKLPCDWHPRPAPPLAPTLNPTPAKAEDPRRWAVECDLEIEFFDTLIGAVRQANYLNEDNQECGHHRVYEVMELPVDLGVFKSERAVPESEEEVMDEDKVHTFAELSSTGMLWLINRVVFHPRGYALAIYIDDDGVADHWTMLGDGTEAWTMGDDIDEDDLLATANAFLDGLKPKDPS